MRDQQLQECQHRIEELSWKHEAAVDEGNTLRQQVASFTKLVILWWVMLLHVMFGIFAGLQTRLVTCVICKVHTCTHTH